MPLFNYNGTLLKSTVKGALANEIDCCICQDPGPCFICVGDEVGPLSITLDVDVWQELKNAESSGCVIEPCGANPSSTVLQFAQRIDGVHSFNKSGQDLPCMQGVGGGVSSSTIVNEPIDQPGLFDGLGAIFFAPGSCCNASTFYPCIPQGQIIHIETGLAYTNNGVLRTIAIYTISLPLSPANVSLEMLNYAVLPYSGGMFGTQIECSGFDADTTGNWYNKAGQIASITTVMGSPPTNCVGPGPHLIPRAATVLDPYNSIINITGW